MKAYHNEQRDKSIGAPNKGDFFQFCPRTILRCRWS